MRERWQLKQSPSLDEHGNQCVGGNGGQQRGRSGSSCSTTSVSGSYSPRKRGGSYSSINKRRGRPPKGGFGPHSKMNLTSNQAANNMCLPENGDSLQSARGGSFCDQSLPKKVQIVDSANNVISTNGRADSINGRMTDNSSVGCDQNLRSSGTSVENSLINISNNGKNVPTNSYNRTEDRSEHHHRDSRAARIILSESA